MDDQADPAAAMEYVIARMERRKAEHAARKTQTITPTCQDNSVLVDALERSIERSRQRRQISE